MAIVPEFSRKPGGIIQAWCYAGPALHPDLDTPDTHWITTPGLQALSAPISPTKHWGGNCGDNNCPEKWTVSVETAHGPADVRIGDWIAKGPIDWWPIDHVHFEDTYQPANELAQERAEWQALVDADTLHMIPPEAHIASVKHLAGRLLELTGNADPVSPA